VSRNFNVKKSSVAPTCACVTKGTCPECMNAGLCSVISMLRATWYSHQCNDVHNARWHEKVFLSLPRSAFVAEGRAPSARNLHSVRQARDRAESFAAPRRAFIPIYLSRESYQRKKHCERNEEQHQHQHSYGPWGCHDSDQSLRYHNTLIPQRQLWLTASSQAHRIEQQQEYEE